MTTVRFARLMALGAFCVAPLVAAGADDDHVVTNVVNGVVYVSLGTRDGAANGSRIEVLGEGKEVLGTLDLELCGEVICRARLPPQLAGKIMRGMLVRLPSKVAPGTPKPSVAPDPDAPPVVMTGEQPPAAPIASSSASSIAPPPVAPPPVASTTKMRPPPRFYTGLTLESVLAPHGGGGSKTQPTETRYTDGPVPKGYAVVSRPYPSVVKAGWWIFGVTYGLSALSGLGGGEASSLMFVPVLGPWMYIAVADKSSGDFNGPAALAGIGQAIGVLLIGIGYNGQQMLVKKETGVTLNLAPMVVRDGYGLGFTGTL